MTTPDERTRAVRDARWFLQTVIDIRDEVVVPGLLQSVALGLLRHYPRDDDLAHSASALPSVWGDPVADDSPARGKR